MESVKNSGDIVEFDLNKLRKSLLKSGDTAVAVSTFLLNIKAHMCEGISTKQICKMAFLLLKKLANAHAARFNLRQAIRLLSPAGFFFEEYLARLFSLKNYKTITNLTL